jgi:hypothetical protein
MLNFLWLFSRRSADIKRDSPLTLEAGASSTLPEGRILEGRQRDC